MKNDAPTPATVPTKRRQVRHALDRWIAEWLAREDLTTAERDRLERERTRRRNARPIRTVSIVMGREGMTPKQQARVVELTAADDDTLVHVIPTVDYRMAVLKASVVIAAPKSGTPDGHVWDAVRYARHRKVPVHVVLPNGEEAS